MGNGKKTQSHLEKEIQRLQKELGEATSTLNAIRAGEVDAIVVHGDKQTHVYTLKRADQSFLTLVEEMLEGAVIFALDGTIIYCNSSFAEMVGMPVKKVIGSSFYQFVLPSRKIDIEKTLKKIDKDGLQFEMELKTALDKNIPALLSIKKTTIEKEELFTTTIVDLSEQKRNEEIIARGRLIESMLKQSQEAILVCDVEGRIIMSSEPAREMAGKTNLNQYFKNVFPNIVLMLDDPSGSETIKQIPFSIDDILQGKFFYNIEGKFQRGDGKIYNILLRAQSIRDEKDNIIGAVVGFSDITRIKKTESKRVALFQISHAAFSAGNLKEFYSKVHQIVGKVCYAENFYIALYYRNKKRFEFVYVVDEYEKSRLPSALAEILINKVTQKKEPLLASKSEIKNWVLEKGEKFEGKIPNYFLGVPLKVKDQPIGVLALQTYRNCVSFDEEEMDFLRVISEQVAMAIERIRINEENKFHNTVLTWVPYGVLILDHTGKLVWANSTFCQMIDYSMKELQDEFPPIYKDSVNFGQLFVEIVKSLEESQSWQGELVVLRKDGSNFPAEAIFSPIERNGSYLARYVAIIQDVSEKRELEQQFFQAQKMEAIGKLAGGVAHDFNNILTIINGYSDLLLARLDTDHPFYKEISMIRKAGERASGLTNQLLAFSRKQMIRPRNLNLNTIIKDTEKMLKRLIGEDIELVTHLDPDLNEIHVDPTQIDQIIMNLAVNARDAMPKGGKLTIETKNVELDQSYIQKHGEVKAGSYVMLSISDTGIGIDKETMQHIFEPFFTTKGKGEGTGLGLSTVYGIVKQNNGYIWVYSEPGEGAVFKIYFPITSKKAGDVEVEKISSEELIGNETILLAEDDHWVRELTKSTLEAYGYKVLEVERGDEALKICKEFKNPIHLLLTDVVMPGMSGSELAKKILEYHKDIKILYMSGYTDDAMIRYGIRDKEVEFLQKPFSSKVLLEKVRKILNK